MVEWQKISGFQWDEGNARKSSDKHGVSQAEAEQIFFNRPLLIAPDPNLSQSEPRYHALGVTDGHRLLHVSFTLCQDQTLIRVMSARDMHRKERSIYEQA